MIVYLANLKELNEYLINNYNIKSNDFKINNDCINSYSIKLDQNYPESWSQCMKYLLTILKSYIALALQKEGDEYKEILEKSTIINNK